MTIEPEDLDRLTAYAYLAAPDRGGYLAVMRVFTATLLADLSAKDVTERLRAQGLDLPVEVVSDKLEQLTRWGNLLPSSRPVRAASISDYHRVRSRFQLSALGERVQRQADRLLADAGAAREVSRELLAAVAAGLRDLAARQAHEPDAALERVTTVFAQFDRFADSVRDFYAHLGQVAFRYDLDTAELAGFKQLLLDYAETVNDDVAHFAPRIQEALDELWPRLPGLLARIDAAEPGLAAVRDQGVALRRSRGRELADWAELRGWFLGSAGEGSQVDRLREATLRALQALLAGAKRMIRSSSGEQSRRKDLLKLATWFDQADDRTAHDLHVAAFGLYGCRHLGIAHDPDLGVPATTSWWHGPPVEVPVSLRERGSRQIRGRTAAAEDYGQQRARLRREAEEESARQRVAAAELRAAAPRLDSVRLSPRATRLLLDLLARALAGAPPAFDAVVAEDADLDLRLELCPRPGGATIRGADGDLELDGLMVRLSGAGSLPRTEEEAV